MLGYMLARQHIQKVQQLSQQEPNLEPNQAKGFVYARAQPIYIYSVCCSRMEKRVMSLWTEGTTLWYQIRSDGNPLKKIKTFFFQSPLLHSFWGFLSIVRLHQYIYPFFFLFRKKIFICINTHTTLLSYICSSISNWERADVWMLVALVSLSAE